MHHSFLPAWKASVKRSVWETLCSHLWCCIIWLDPLAPEWGLSSLSERGIREGSLVCCASFHISLRYSCAMLHHCTYLSVSGWALAGKMNGRNIEDSVIFSQSPVMGHIVFYLPWETVHKGLTMNVCSGIHPNSLSMHKSCMGGIVPNRWYYTWDKGNLNKEINGILECKTYSVGV